MWVNVRFDIFPFGSVELKIDSNGQKIDKDRIYYEKMKWINYSKIWLNLRLNKDVSRERKLNNIINVLMKNEPKLIQEHFFSKF